MLAVLAAAAALLLPAHASVIGTTPLDGSTVTEQPGSFSVALNEPIIDVPGGASATAMALTDASGRYYGDGCAAVDGDTVSLDADLGAAGDYTLTYRVVSTDGHSVSGAVSFAFEPADGAAGAEGAAAAPVCGGTVPVGSEPTASGTAGGSSDAPAATASADRGAPLEGDAPAEDAGGQPPFLAIGVLALLAVLAVIAHRVNRLRGDRAADDA